MGESYIEDGDEQAILLGGCGDLVRQARDVLLSVNPETYPGMEKTLDDFSRLSMELDYALRKYKERR